MITVKVHAEGAVIDNDLPLERISDVLATENALVWVDAQHASAEELDLLRAEFSLHPLALEDATVRHERPKFEEFDGFLLIIFYAFTFEVERAVITIHQVSIFAGRNYILTLHDSDMPVLDDVSTRWCHAHAHIKTPAAALLVYSIVDSLVDQYLPIIDQLSERIDAIEDAIFARFDADTLQQIFRLKRDLLLMRKVLTPERDVLNALMRRDTPIYDQETARYFQDIYDHLLRVLDSVDTFRDLLTSALESHLSMLSNRMNKIMKTLTGWSIILMGMTLVASIYGMNFVHMPELRWQLGYLYALGLMAAIGIGLGYLFKRIDWL